MADGDPKRPARLGKAPIVEAIIDIHVDPPLASLDALEPFEVLAHAKFPDRKRVIQWQGSVDLSSEEPKVTSPPLEVKGFAFWTLDKRKVLQARVNGLSLSHLAPYETWSALERDARGWWDEYRRLTGAAVVTRYAVRFINRLELPLPMKDFADYLRTMPTVARGLPQGLSGVFMRLVVPFPDATAIITQAIDEAGVTAEKVPVILDIDVAQSERLPADGDELWKKLERLRKLKNDVFFESLTPAAWRLFE